MNRQRELALQRLAHKRRKREDKEYESDLAMAMIMNASKTGALLREKTMALQGAQKYSVLFSITIFYTLLFVMTDNFFGKGECFSAHLIRWGGGGGRGLKFR